METLQRVLIIDDDHDILAQMKAVFETSFSCPDVVCCGDARSGMEAIDAMGDSPYEIVFVDLRMPKISGDAVLQHIHLHDKRAIRNLLVVVICGTIGKDEITLLKELGFTGILKKPFRDKDFVERVEAILTSSDPGVEELKWVQQFEALIRDKRYGEAEKRVMGKLKKDPSNIKYLTNMAQLLFYMNQIKRCEDVLAKVLKRDSTFLPALNLASKVQMQAGRYDEALKLLDKAQNLSPQNIERLLAMGEVNLGQGKGERAEEQFRKALNINSENRRAKFGLGRSLAAQGRVSESQKVMSELGNTEEFAAYFNNKGILLVKAGRYKEGVEVYESGMKILNDPERQFRMQYNIALAWFRAKKYQKAIEAIDDCLEQATEPFPKANQLKEKIQLALQELNAMLNNGQEPVAEAPEPVGQPETEKDDLEKEIEKYADEDTDSSVTLTNDQNDFLMGGFDTGNTIDENGDMQEGADGETNKDDGSEEVGFIQ